MLLRVELRLSLGRSSRSRTSLCPTRSSVRKEERLGTEVGTGLTVAVGTFVAAGVGDSVGEGVADGTGVSVGIGVSVGGASAGTGVSVGKVSTSVGTTSETTTVAVGSGTGVGVSVGVAEISSRVAGKSGTGVTVATSIPETEAEPALAALSNWLPEPDGFSSPLAPTRQPSVNETSRRGKNRASNSLIRVQDRRWFSPRPCAKGGRALPLRPSHPTSRQRAS